MILRVGAFVGRRARQSYDTTSDLYELVRFNGRPFQKCATDAKYSLKDNEHCWAQTKRCTFMAVAPELRCGDHLARARRGASLRRSRALGRALEERGRPLAEGMQPKCRHVAKEHSSCLSSATIWIFGRWRRLGTNPAGGVRAQFNLWRGRASRAAMPSGPSAATTQTG